MYHTRLMPPVDIDATVIANARLSRDYSVLSLAAPEVGAAHAARPVRDGEAGGRDRPAAAAAVLGVRSAARRRRRGHRRQHPQQARRAQHQQALRARSRRRGVVPRSARRALHAGDGADRSLDGRRRRRPGAVCHARRSAGGARTPATLFYGARTAEELFYLEFFERLGVTLVLTTEDGRRGVKGASPLRSKRR